MHVFKEVSAVKESDIDHQDSDLLRPHSYTRWEVDKIKLYLDERGYITDSNTAAQFFLGCSFLEKDRIHISKFLPQLQGVRLIDDEGHVSDHVHALADSEEHLKFYSISGHLHFGKMQFFQDGNYFNRTIRLMIIPKN